MLYAYIGVSMIIMYVVPYGKPHKIVAVYVALFSVENTSEQTGLMSGADPSVKFQTIHHRSPGGGTSESGSAGSNSRLTFNGSLWSSFDRTALHRNQIQNIGMLGKRVWS